MSYSFFATMIKILTIIILVSWSVKLLLHFHLDFKSSRIKGLAPAGMLPFYYFLPYFQPLADKYLNEAKICNIFYLIAVASTIFFLIIRGY